MGIAHIRRQQFVLEQARTILHGDHGQLVGIVRAGGFLDDDRRKPVAVVEQAAHLFVVDFFLGVERHRVRRFTGHHYEQGWVDDVRTFAQDLALRAFLPAVIEESAHVAEVVDAGVVCQGLAGGQVDTVTCEDVADGALGDGHHWVNVDTVLERREEVETAAAEFWLQACFAIQCEQPALHGAGRVPEFFNNPDTVVRDVLDDAGNQQQQQCSKQNRCYNDEAKQLA